MANITNRNVVVMKAMIFAAGRGERMGALTQNTPKPLLSVGGKALIEHLLEKLQQAGIREVVINLAYLGEQIEQALRDGQRWGMAIQYSKEPYPLETGGGILRALDQLGRQPFLLVNADVWTDYPFASLVQRGLYPGELGHLVMVTNPDHHPRGDFYLTSKHVLSDIPVEESKHPPSTGVRKTTYSGIALLDPAIIADYPQRREKFPLGEVFRAAMQQQQLSGELYEGDWQDIGTAERLAALDQALSNQAAKQK